MTDTLDPAGTVTAAPVDPTGGRPHGERVFTARQNFLPYALPFIGEEEIDEVVDSLRSGWVTTGPKVKRFEAAVAEAVDASHAVAVSSCTAGLHLSLVALGIGPGDEVIVPTMTFCATANVVEHVGATPVLVDVGQDGNVDTEAARRAVTPRTRAIIPVHFAGQAVDLDDVYRMAADNDLAVVEDAAHAIGGIYRGRPIGADDLSSAHPDLRRTTVFSFYATKNMTTGEGGMVVAADEELADKIRLQSLHGMSRSAWQRYSDVGTWYYEVAAPGFKANMTDLQAALGIHQLGRLPGFIASRQDLAAHYDTALGGIDRLTLPTGRPDRNHVYHLYVVHLDERASGVDRSAFIDALRSVNIGTSVHFIPIHLHPHYRDRYGFDEGDFPTATELYRGSVSLPLYPRMSGDDVRYVTDAISHILEGTEGP